jgi:hypothetical protein
MALPGFTAGETLGGQKLNIGLPQTSSGAAARFLSGGVRQVASRQATRADPVSAGVFFGKG